jgi:hypothetical protein
MLRHASGRHWWRGGHEESLDEVGSARPPFLQVTPDSPSSFLSLALVRGVGWRLRLFPFDEAISPASVFLIRLLFDP